MASRISAQRTGVALLAVACTAVLVWFGYGLNPLWPLMWLAPLPVLLLVRRPARQVALLAFAAWFLGCLTYVHYFRMLHVPWVVVLSMEALLFTGAVLLYRALLLRGAPWLALLSVPALWAGFEYILSHTTSGGTAGSLSYTQLHFLPVLQLASVTGPWGITFVVLLFSTTLATAWHLRRTARRQAVRIAAAGLGALAVVLLFGVVRLAEPAVRNPVKVGLLTSDISANDSTAPAGADATRIFQDYAAAARQLIAQGAQVIVLPEKLAVVANANPREAGQVFQPIADQTGATFVVGVLRAAPPNKYNRALVFQPHASTLTYDKERMLPPFESPLTPGVSLTLLPHAPAPWGVAICKDLDFTNPARRYGLAGVGLLLAPAWDFNIDRAWHGHIAILRGVENGFSIARAAKNGYLTVSDDRGRILGEVRSDSAPIASLLVSVPSVHDPTLYLVLGDWFAWLSIALFLLALLRCFRPRKA
ncbi:MAG TPA: nitrilase-related carbon-nitrogen hydrolase [Terracidiphilus sp.]|nr:nitrilase-related carbon-nitrogen hydrolase [Terracidiphilus sp.]